MARASRDVSVRRQRGSEAFASKLDECVRIHLRSDVPVGCALSGGLDSSAIAVLFHSQGGGATDLHTFTSTCAGDPTEEREYVEAVLDGIRATPHFVTPSAQGFLDDLKDFVWQPRRAGRQPLDVRRVLRRADDPRRERARYF